MSVSAIAAGGADYYAKDDYFFGKAGQSANGPEAPRTEGATPLTWGGRGAGRLGLEGPAALNDFKAVMSGRNPDPSGPPLSAGGSSVPGGPGGA